MKTLKDYKKEWQKLAEEMEEGYIIKEEVYILFHFLEDVKAKEPWKEKDRANLQKAMDQLTEEDIKELNRLFETVFKHIDNTGETA